MLEFFNPPAARPRLASEKIDGEYRRMRLRVFLGAFFGYAAYYLVRKNLSLAAPGMMAEGLLDKESAGFAMAGIPIAYAFSKFLMGSLSDRSDARKFLVVGLVVSSIVMMCVGLVPYSSSIAVNAGILFAFMLAVGWLSGMGWPPCGRIMAHWFSQNERGTRMSVWNCAHNVGGALVGPMAVYGATWFGSWFYGAHTQYYFLAGTFLFPAATAILLAIIAYCLLRDTPQSCGLPAVEKWRNDYPKNYSAESETVLSTKDIFFKYVLNNKFLWFIAMANAFVYMVRYGCLDWAPTLLTAKNIDLKSAGWAYFAYEFAAIPGTLICGWMSDKIFHGARALPTMIFMAIVAVFIGLYWAFIDNLTVVLISLIGIGFFIYGPVMLIGVQALDLAPKNAAGTAAGLTGFFGYFFGTAILANTVIGYVAQNYGWNQTFILLIVACLLAIALMGFTFRQEKHLLNKKNTDKK